MLADSGLLQKCLDFAVLLKVDLEARHDARAMNVEGQFILFILFRRSVGVFWAVFELERLLWTVKTCVEIGKPALHCSVLCQV